METEKFYLHCLFSFEETCIRHGKRFGEQCGRCKIWMILFMYLFHVSIMRGYFHAYHLMNFVTWANHFFFIVFWRAWIVFVVEKLDSGQPVAVDISVTLVEVCIAFEWLLLNIIVSRLFVLQLKCENACGYAVGEFIRLKVGRVFK